jgi:hypothetical protein
VSWKCFQLHRVHGISMIARQYRPLPKSQRKGSTYGCVSIGMFADILGFLSECILVFNRGLSRRRSDISSTTTTRGIHLHRKEKRERKNVRLSLNGERNRWSTYLAWCYTWKLTSTGLRVILGASHNIATTRARGLANISGTSTASALCCVFAAKRSRLRCTSCVRPKVGNQGGGKSGEPR